MKILCVGHASYDITIPMDGFVLENTKTRVNEKIECGGGPASTAAYLLGKWGMDTTFVGMVGNDDYGKFIINELNSVNVNTNYIDVSDKIKTTSSFIIANRLNGSRTIITHVQDNIKMDSIDLDFEPDIILVDGQEYNLSIDLINKHPNALSIMDAGRYNESNASLAKKVDYVVCSHEFAEGVANMKFAEDDSNLENIYLKLKDQYNNIIVTLESKGCLYDYDGEIRVMPSIKVDAVDSTGAGDIFHGAFVYAVANQFNLEDALLFSNITAGLSVTRVGGRNSVFELDEIMKEYNEFK